MPSVDHTWDWETEKNQLVQGQPKSVAGLETGVILTSLSALPVLLRSILLCFPHFTAPLVTCPRAQASPMQGRGPSQNMVHIHQFVPGGFTWKSWVLLVLEVLSGAWPPGPGFSSGLLAPALSWIGPAYLQGACPPGSAPGPGCCLSHGHAPVRPEDWPGLTSYGDSWHCIPYDKVLELDTEATLQWVTALLQQWPAV